MTDKLDIIFMGTPDFADESLKALINSRHNIKAVFTQPDKPKGRGYKMIPSPVKVTALENNIEVYQPTSLRKGEDAEKSLKIIQDINPDIIIVVAYGQILPKTILELPRLGCVNIHGSLLPSYRGAAPIEMCVMNGEKETGVTSMYMGEGLDTGDMLISEKTEIGENETALELRARLSVIGAEVLLKTIDGLINNTITPQKQNDEESSYAHCITKNMSLLDFSKPAITVHNVIRSITGFTIFEGKRLKIYTSEVVDKEYDLPNGSIVDEKEFIVVCGDKKGVKFTTIQPEGKKKMNTSDYLRGKKITKGYILGE